MVEQLGVRGTLAISSEIVRGGHESFTKEMQPHAVDHHTSSERVLWVGEPMRELQSAALLHIGQCSTAAGSQEAARDGRPELLGLAADVELAVFDFFGLAHAHGERGVGGVGKRGFGRCFAWFVGGDDGLCLSMWQQFGGGLKLVQRRLRRGEALACGCSPQSLGAFEDACERVVVAGGNGVCFVIVTAGAADAETEDAAADDVDLIGYDIHLKVFVHGLRGLRAKREQSSGDELSISLLGRIGR